VCRVGRAVIAFRESMQNRRFFRGPSLLLLLAAGLLAMACGRGAAPRAGFDLREMVAARHYVLGGWSTAGLWFPEQPEVAEETVDSESRPVVLGSPRGWRWRGRVPSAARLHVGAQAAPVAGPPVAGPPAVRVVAIHATVRQAGRWQTFRSPAASREGAPRWLDLDVDLAPWAGRTVEIAVSAVTAAEPPPAVTAVAKASSLLTAAPAQEPVIAWGPAGIFTPQPAARPNIILIVVDTLRRDRLTPYGYARDTSPQIERRLALPGTVVEQAYSQAPWTLPSVTSFMTGHYSREMLGPRPAAFLVPQSIEPLAERLENLGFVTGGFVGNPILGVWTGLNRGFGTYYLPPAHPLMDALAVDLNRHAIPWLAAHRDRPFFLYIQYVDPHDPYDDPDIVNNRSPFEASYSGPVTGMWPEFLNVGGFHLEDPQRDLAHLNALYDAEVHYVDRAIGEILASVPAADLAHTLVVLTADHGEEIDDHGGWKHGQALYDELIHVPLIFRWDGHIPAGRRLAGTVRLVDLLPTLLDAAGGAAEPGGAGIDILPYLKEGRRPPELPVFSEAYAAGPLRAAAVLGQTKLLLFNREEPFLPKDLATARLYERDHRRFARVERYDLARDPGERHNLGGGAAPAGPIFDRLQNMIVQQLNYGVVGVRLLVQQAPVGSPVEVTARFARRATACRLYFLGAEDRIESCGDTVRFTLRGEALDKGILVEGDVGALLGAAVTVGGRPLPTAQIRLGRGVAYRGGAVREEGLLATEYPGAAPPGAGCRLLIWEQRREGLPPASEAQAEEVRRRLRALGYIR
jgi:arylsulfatase A-like enzyme